MYYYEIHEGDEDIGTAVILAHETRFKPLDFLRLVQEARNRVVDVFEEDTLTEAIAAELERRHGFVYISDDRLTAAVNVAEDEADTYLTATGDEHRSIYLSIDPSDEELN